MDKRIKKYKIGDWIWYRPLSKWQKVTKLSKEYDGADIYKVSPKFILWHECRFDHSISPWVPKIGEKIWFKSGKRLESPAGVYTCAGMCGDCFYIIGETGTIANKKYFEPYQNQDGKESATDIRSSMDETLFNIEYEEQFINEKTNNIKPKNLYIPEMAKLSQKQKPPINYKIAIQI